MTATATLLTVGLFVQLAIGLGALLWALFYVWNKALTWFVGFLRVNKILILFARSYYAHKRKKDGQTYDGVYRPKLKEESE